MPSAFRFIVLLVCLFALTGCRQETLAVWPNDSPSAESMVFPVALYQPEFEGITVCRNAAEIRNRKEYEVKSMAARYQIIDSAGMRFSIRNLRVVQGPASFFWQVLDGSIATGAPMTVDFQVVPEGMAPTRYLWDKLESIHYTLRKCGIGPETAPRQLMQARGDWRCAPPD